MIVSKYYEIDGKMYVESSDYDKILYELKNSNEKIAKIESELFDVRKSADEYYNKCIDLTNQIAELESELEVNDMPLDEFIVKVDGVAEFLKSEIRICDKRLEEEQSPYYDGVNVGFTNAQELNINHLRFCKKLLEMMNFEQ